MISAFYVRILAPFIVCSIILFSGTLNIWLRSIWKRTTWGITFGLLPTTRSRTSYATSRSIMRKMKRRVMTKHTDSSPVVLLCIYWWINCPRQQLVSFTLPVALVAWLLCQAFEFQHFKTRFPLQTCSLHVAYATTFILA